MDVKMGKENAKRVVASFKDFDGDGEKWKAAFYELWRTQIAWSYANEITVQEGRNGVFVDMLVNPNYEECLLNTMQDLGYRNIKTHDEPVGVLVGLPESWNDVYTFVGQ